MMNHKLSLGLALLPLVPSVQAREQGGQGQGACNDKRLNIIFIMSDDHARQAMSIYGHPIGAVAPTPNIDRIGQEGAVFRNNYCCNSISGPSRAAILTGKHSHKNGFMRNGNKGFDGSQQTLPKILQANGYETAVIGKWHLISKPTGFDHWMILNDQGDYYNPQFITESDTSRHKGYVTDLITRYCEEWLDNGRDKDKPFFLMMHHKAIHRNWVPAERHYHLYEHTRFPLPDNYYDAYEGRYAAQMQKMNIYRDMYEGHDLKMVAGIDSDSLLFDPWPHAFLGTMTPAERRRFLDAYRTRNNEFYSKPRSFQEVAEWKYQRYLQDYMACVASVDESVGEILDYLKRTGLDKNTIVVYTTDQGFYLGEHGWFDKRFMYEESFGMPMVMRWRGHIRPGTQVTGLTQNIDFAPTFLDMCGISTPQDMQGVSFRELVEKGKTPRNWRESLYYHYYEFPGFHSVRAHYGVKTERYKLMHFYVDDNWELYDLKADAEEMHNLYGKKGMEEITSGLKTELARLQKEYDVPQELCFASSLHAQEMRMDTYCNPLNIDYTYMIYNSDKDISYRSGADPAVVKFRGEYYMFVTRSHGYWRSRDLLNWEFVKPGRNWYPQGCNAPAAHNYKDSVLYVAGDPSGSMSILYTDNPASGDWEATPAILHNLQDPDLFIDDDGKAYMFWGSSNVYPIRGMELDKNHRFIKKGETKELFNLDMPQHGWERFGENHMDTVLGGYIEGPWLTKHNGKYYMQYGAPGTEFNVYADGVYVADHPMGPYTYQKHNPVSYKPGGYMNGAGHGSTVLGPGGRYWHFASMSLSINVNWERRLCMFPAGFDKDGIMYVDTRFGDYPRYAPAVPGKAGEFRGWMLLSYNKPVTASTTRGEFKADALTDELTKTFWLAEANDERQWVTIDLEKPANVYALQINYHDYQSNMYGRYEGLRHRYVVEGSLDGQNWEVLVDRKDSYKDTPNDYVDLGLPHLARYVRYKNIDVPTPNLAISELRVFGLGTGKAPRQPEKLTLDRHADRRDISIAWEPVKGAQGYNVLWGIAPDKLYSSWMVYGKNDLLMKSLTAGQDYYFCVEAFNENGVSLRSEVKYVK